MSEWKSFSLGDVATFRNGRKRPLATGDIPVYGGNGILSYTNQFNFNNCVVIGRVGAYCGNVFLAKKYCWVSDNAIATLPKESVNTYFLFYLLKSLRLNTHSIGSGQPLLTQGILNELKITCPSLDTQKKIATVLSALDDKIELNNAINKNLEEQAQAIYKSWFIDFEPFGGTMPDDWEFTNLGNVTDNVRERITNFNTPVFSAVNTGHLVLSDDFFNKRVYSKDIKKYLLVREGDFAYNPARINIGSIGLNDFGYEGCVSPVYVVFRVNANYRAFFRFYFKTKTFVEECLSRGSGSVRQSLNYDDFSLIEMIYPSNEYARKFNELWENYFFVIQNISRENQKLGELRDALLPRLMSGEIDVSAVEI